MRLLIADDDKDIARALTVLFEHSNYSVDAVYNGNDAYDYALGGDYDGLVLDVMMPGMDGITVLKKLRAAGVTAPALLLTAKSEVEDRVAGLDAGADDYLPKPFAANELLARVRAMLRRLLAGGRALLRHRPCVGDNGRLYRLPCPDEALSVRAADVRAGGPVQYAGVPGRVVLLQDEVRIRQAHHGLLVHPHLHGLRL